MVFSRIVIIIPKICSKYKISIHRNGEIILETPTQAFLMKISFPPYSWGVSVVGQET